MLLALISDTHDNQPAARAAVALCAAHKPAAYLHAGDLVSPFMLDVFAGLPFYFVFGNNEFDHAALRSGARAMGLHCMGNFGDLAVRDGQIEAADAGTPADSLRIALLHGHEHMRLERAAHSGIYRYVIHGHTHVARDELVSGPAGLVTRIINPGALYRARTRTVALLETDNDTVRFLEVRA